MGPAQDIPQPLGAWCLFLDIDGTLLELADAPHAVGVDADLLPLLEQLRVSADGAVALITGRTIADTDRLLGTTEFPVAGLHGCERRDVGGRIVAAQVDREQVAAMRQKMEHLVTRHPGLLLEDKGATLALHYLNAPELEGELRAQVEQLGQLGFTVQHGRAVLELKPEGHTKGTAIRAFMQQPPFVHRTPVFLGDDLSDSDGFDAVREYGGIAIAVGPRVSSQWWLPDPPAVRRWLESLLTS